jgi:tetratricopeptide (TPR) repeat protein
VGLIGSINNAAHVGGLILGLVIGGILCLMRKAEYSQKLVGVAATVLILIAGFLSVHQLRAEVADYGKASDAAERKDWKKSEAYARQVLKRDPNDEAGLMALSYAQRMQGQSEQAEATLLGLRAAHPNNLFATSELAEIYVERKDAARAEPLLRSALERAPNNPGLHVAQGKYWELKGRADSAEAEYEQAIQLNPRSSDAHLALGQLYARQAQRDNARKELQKALELDPSNQDAKKELQQLPAQ